MFEAFAIFDFFVNRLVNRSGVLLNMLSLSTG